MTECYFTPKKNTTSATICANCGREKSLHTIGEGVRANKVIIMTDSEIEHQIEMDEEEDSMWEDEDNFQCCDNCDLPDACSDFGCAIQQGLRKDVSW